MMKKTILLSTITTSFLLIGCGSSSSTTDTTTDTTLSTAYLVDSAVVNADYDCISDNEYNKTTGPDGSFSCKNMSQIRFRLGELTIGEIDTVPADNYVFPQDLLHVTRDANLMDTNVTALAQLLQSLDEDQDPTNGIVIPDEVKSKLEDGTFDAQYLLDYVNEAEVLLVDQVEAQNHLRDTLRSHQTSGEQQIGGQGYGSQGNAHNSNNIITDDNTTQTTVTPLVDVSQYPLSTLTDELKNAMAHMGNEERLAYDVYMNLYNYHKDNGLEIYQLYNIAQNSEQVHVATVQSLVQRYDLSADDIDTVDSTITEDNNMSNDLTLDNMPSGVYDIPAIQELYNVLYDKGIQSQQDALEVGCMVEVTDVNDLDEYVALAQESNALDAEAVFTAIRSGSYNHYWAFDKGLKNIGIIDGCCSLGDEWCHPEYPQNSH